MAHHRGWIHSIVIAAVVLALPPVAAAQMRKGTKDSSDASQPKSYLPPDNYSPTQLRAHIDKLHKTSVKDRKPEVAEGIVVAADRILAADPPPPESLRTFAVISLLDGLHQEVEDGKNADADTRLAQEAAKYAKDNGMPVAITAQFYVLEQRVLKPDEIPVADLPKVLDEVKADISDRVLTAKYHRIINNIEPLINRLPTDQEADQRFKDFSRVLLASHSSDTEILKLANKFRTAKRDAKAGATAADGAKPPEKS